MTCFHSTHLNSFVMPSSVFRLAASKHFVISHEYETVWLDRENGSRVSIGDFYGDPTVALIDLEERWCALGGAGVIVYFLDEPFFAYEYGTNAGQWCEIGREQESLWHVAAIEQTGPSSVSVRLENGKLHALSFRRTATGVAEFNL